MCGASSRNCRLYLEKLNITFPEQDCLFNKKFKLISKFGHKNKYLFSQLAPDREYLYFCKHRLQLFPPPPKELVMIVILDNFKVLKSYFNPQSVHDFLGDSTAIILSIEISWQLQLMYFCGCNFVLMEYLMIKISLKADAQQKLIPWNRQTYTTMNQQI